MAKTKPSKSREWKSFCLAMTPIPVFIGAVFLVAIVVSISFANSPSGVAEKNVTRSYSIDMNEFQQNSEKIASFGTRLPGEIGSNLTRAYLAEHFRNASFIVDFDSFSQDTIIGKRYFTNIIARYTVNPAFKTVILAAHYDSKKFDFYFIGASDSLIPCVMLAHMGKAITQWKNLTHNVEIILFDGEEAFVDWTQTDSLYGSRHLAEKYEKEGRIDKVDWMMLLDLLGAANPRFLNFQMHFNSQTTQFYSKIVNIQKKYGVSWFSDNSTPYGVEDDHIPWLQRGVRILHMIPVPFPSIWHQASDNIANMDWNTSEKLMRIFLDFLGGYL